MAKALTYFRSGPWGRILEALRDRYVALGRVGGNAVLEHPTPEEIAALSGFLGRAPKADPHLFVSLRNFDARLGESAFACTLPELIDAFWGLPVMTRPAERRIREDAFELFLREVASEFQGGLAGEWWTRVQASEDTPTARILRREWEKDAGALRGALGDVAGALRALSHAGEAKGRRRLPVFAGQVAGDPHAFDADRSAGRLLERALLNLHPDADSILSGVESATLRRDLTLAAYGIIKDDVSSYVLVWGLDAKVGSSSLPSSFSFHLPLREVDRLTEIHVWAGRVYVVENPAVFSELVDALESKSGARSRERAPLVVCTGGFPSMAAFGLLDRLAKIGATIYYSGDFDENGLVIAESILRRYPARAHPWRMSVGDYERACIGGGGGVAFASGELERLARRRSQFPELVDAMMARRRKAFQEGIVESLVLDVVSEFGMRA